MKKTFKTICAAVLALILVLSFAGCGSKKKGDSAKATPRPTPDDLRCEIKISGYLYSDEKNNLEKFKNVFVTDYPSVEVSIDLQRVSTKAYFEELDKSYERGKLSGVGDVILVDAQRAEKYAQEGLIISLSPYIGTVMNFETYKTINPANDLLPAAYEAGLYNGEVYMIPIEYNHKFILINFSLINKAGFSFPADDWCWDDLIEMAEVLKASGVETPIAMDYTDYAVWGAFARSYGQDVYDYVGNSDSVKELNLTHPDVIKGLEDMAEIVDPERGLVACVNSKDIAPEDISKYAFIVADHEDITVWREALLDAEDLTTDGEKWNWDYIHFPRWKEKDENGEYTDVYYQAIAANVYGFAVVNHEAYGDHDEAHNEEFYRACAYLALNATVTKAAVSYALDGQSVPASREANARKFWREYPKSGKNSSVFSLFAEVADFSGSLGCFMPVYSVSELDPAYIEKAVADYLSGTRSMKESLQTIQENAQASWLTR